MKATEKMIAKMQEMGIANLWKKNGYNRLYIDLDKANEIYYNNDDLGGQLCMNRRDRQNGKLWIDLDTNEISAKWLSSEDEVIAQIVELVNYYIGIDEAAAATGTADTTDTADCEEDEEMEMHNGHKVWYAVMMDNEDTDHGTGSFREEEALQMASQLRKQGHPDAYVALIDPEDDYCIDEIRDF